jgi:4-hydroxy-tetrahydrodipicolinate synthase
MAGSGGNNTAQTVELSKLCVDAGADSLLVVTPPYNKPGLNGLKAHFEAVTNAVNIPVTLYHVPSRTGSFLPADVMLEVLNNDKIKAVKEASGDISYFSKVAMQTSTPLLSGDDFTYLPSLSVGGKGVISVVTNIFPKAFVEMTNLFNKGENEKAKVIHDILFPFTELLFKEPNPAPAKAALQMLNICQNNLRLPLTSILDSNFKELEKSLNETRSKLSEVL